MLTHPSAESPAVAWSGRRVRWKALSSARLPAAYGRCLTTLLFSMVWPLALCTWPIRPMAADGYCTPHHRLARDGNGSLDGRNLPIAPVCVNVVHVSGLGCCEHAAHACAGAHVATLSPRWPWRQHNLMLFWIGTWCTSGEVRRFPAQAVTDRGGLGPARCTNYFFGAESWAWLCGWDGRLRTASPGCAP